MADNIPSGITAEHIERAIVAFDSGQPHAFGDSTRYDLLAHGRRYPPKAIVGIAAGYVTGNQLGPYDFKGGLESKCFRVLHDLGFEVVPKSNPHRYWWVNQNQTFAEETTGGYLWSPRRRADGGRNHFYETMREVQPGDLVFSCSRSNDAPVRRSVTPPPRPGDAAPDYRDPGASTPHPGRNPDRAARASIRKRTTGCASVRRTKGPARSSEQG